MAERLFVSIDYREDAPPAQAYERVRIHDPSQQEIASFATGHPVADWASCIAYLKERGALAYFMSSVNHFVFDVPGYKWIEDEDGVEWLVVDEQDQPAPSASRTVGGAAPGPNATPFSRRD